MSRPVKGNPTDTNIWAARDLMWRNGGVVPLRVPAVDAPHIRRLIKAGWLVRNETGWIPASEHAAAFA